MNIGQIESGIVGTALFDAWFNAIQKSHAQSPRDPLIDAAFAAFEGYISGMEAQHGAMIAGLGAQIGLYSANPAGNAAVPVTIQQMAPFLALNVLA